MTERLLRFPTRYSLGGLYTAPKSQPETWELLTTPQGLIVNPENQPINWQWLDEARGDVLFEDEDDVKLQLKLAASAASSLAPLENLPADALHVFDMSRTQVADLGLTHISHMSSLRVLELAYTPIGDAGLAFIARLGQMQSLGLTATNITSDGLIHLTGLEDLRELWLNGTGIDDSACEHLAGLSNLMLLGLSGTKITDKTIAELKSLKSLLRLYLFNTKASEEAITELRSHLPALRVKWKRPVPTRPEFTLADLVDLSLKTKAEDLSAGSEVMDEAASAAKLDKPTKTLTSPQSHLSESQFWDIIDMLNWDAEGNDDNVIAPAVQHLQKMDKEAIAAFEEILCEKLFLLDGERFAREIGRDSYAGPQRFFSKEWFLAARCCAVANGQGFFEEVLSEPTAMPKDLGFLALKDLAARAYKAKTGSEFKYLTRFNPDSMSNHTGWRSL
ncbi:MAG: DUF4240 domain-containing protein [Cyanobacteria bacterium SZAS LIN-2]|nr:DUF4240 domain-containing protein [Cyanobacteria bacterium SZAS LIN-2]